MKQSTNIDDKDLISKFVFNKKQKKDFLWVHIVGIDYYFYSLFSSVDNDVNVTKLKCKKKEKRRRSGYFVL